jgi:hypothetical protein
MLEHYEIFEIKCLKKMILTMPNSSLRLSYAHPSSFFVPNYRTNDMDSQKKWAFWRADNSIGTFFLQIDPKELVQPQAHDLRLVIANYRLFTVKETVPGSDNPQTTMSHTLSAIGKLLSNAII